MNGVRWDGAALLALKLLLAPALIAGVSLAAQRVGARTAGSLTALPVVAGPIALLLALEQGAAFGARAAQGALAGQLSLGVFCTAYAFASFRWPWYACLPLALAGFAAATLALDAVTLSLGTATVASLAVPFAVPRFLPNPPVPAVHRPITARELGVRMAAGVALVATVTAVASALGPRLAGLLTPFPIAASVLTAFSHHRDGAAFAVQLLRGLCRGLIGMTAFFFVVATALEALGVAAAFALATAAALAVQAVLVARRSRTA